MLVVGCELSLWGVSKNGYATLTAHHIRTVADGKFLANEMVSSIEFRLHKLVRTFDGPFAAVARLVPCMPTAASTLPSMVMSVVGVGISPIAMFMTRQVFFDLMFDVFLETFLRVLGLLFQFTVKLSRRTKGLG